MGPNGAVFFVYYSARSLASAGNTLEPVLMVFTRSDLDEIGSTLRTLAGTGPDRFCARSAQ